MTSDLKELMNDTFASRYFIEKTYTIKILFQTILLTQEKKKIKIPNFYCLYIF